MDRQDIIQNINAASQNRVPYADNLVNELNRLNPQQQEYFLNKVAPYYLDGPGKDPYGMMYKDMLYMATAVRQNKDVSQVLGIDYRRLNSVVPSLPNLTTQPQYQQQQTQPRQPLRTDADRVSNINSLINRNVLHTDQAKQGFASDWFCQSANVENRQLPLQGWKFHISASNLQDYEQLLEKLCPEFDALGISYKVVRPERLMEQLASEQQGKAVTIYPTPALDFNRLSPELKSMLAQDGVKPIGDAQVQGRIYARYGKFRGGLVGQDGHTELDLKHQRTAPNFVKERTPGEVLNFFSDCNQRYAQTDDAKTYLQELATMTRGDGQSNAFVTLTIDNQQVSNAEYALRADPNKNSCIYELNGQNYVLLHNDRANELMQRLDDMGVNYSRPDWDRRYGVYMVHPDHAETAISMVNDFNSANNRNDCSLEMHAISMDNGMIGIEVDTAAHKTFLDLCTQNGVAIKEVARNLSHDAIQTLENDRGWDRIEVGGHEGFDWVR